MSEEKWFIDDTESDAFGKNSTLSAHLSGTWADLDIIKIERDDEGRNGWEATYRV